MAVPQPLQTSLGRLGWKVATRKDQTVAGVVAASGEVDVVYTLETKGLPDSLFQFLKSIGVLTKIEASRSKRFSGNESLRR